MKTIPLFLGLVVTFTLAPQALAQPCRKVTLRIEGVLNSTERSLDELSPQDIRATQFAHVGIPVTKWFPEAKWPDLDVFLVPRLEGTWTLYDRDPALSISDTQRPDSVAAGSIDIRFDKKGKPLNGAAIEYYVPSVGNETARSILRIEFANLVSEPVTSSLTPSEIDNNEIECVPWGKIVQESSGMPLASDQNKQ